MPRSHGVGNLARGLPPRDRNRAWSARVRTAVLHRPRRTARLRPRHRRRPRPARRTHRRRPRLPRTSPTPTAPRAWQRMLRGSARTASLSTWVTTSAARPPSRRRFTAIARDTGSESAARQRSCARSCAEACAGKARGSLRSRSNCSCESPAGSGGICGRGSGLMADHVVLVRLIPTCRLLFVPVRAATLPARPVIDSTGSGSACRSGAGSLTHSAPAMDLSMLLIINSEHRRYRGQGLLGQRLPHHHRP